MTNYACSTTAKGILSASALARKSKAARKDVLEAVFERRREIYRRYHKKVRLQSKQEVI